MFAPAWLMVTRLSDEAGPVGEEFPDPQPLEEVARTLLETAVKKPSVSFRLAIESNPGATEALRRFLQQPRASDSTSWIEIFGAYPPRGVVARVARRCGANLHATMCKRGYHNKTAFRAEQRRMLRWYRHGRRETRRPRGICRGRTQESTFWVWSSPPRFGFDVQGSSSVIVWAVR